MKRKENTISIGQPHIVESEIDASTEKAQDDESKIQEHVFILEEGKLKAFSPNDYSVSPLYQMVESFSVECRLVRPDEPGNVVFEGKKPSRKTVPVVITGNQESVLLDSWENLESRPEILAGAVEVIGVAPVKQVFVLKRK